jgi:hypothetical protein
MPGLNAWTLVLMASGLTITLPRRLHTYIMESNIAVNLAYSTR